MTRPSFDVLVAGGGINGAAIARDAAGRGLSVLLAERGDYGCATSSASSKLVHGGLRYLEQGEFSLVRESLHERAALMASAPHLVKPLRFLLPVRRGHGRPAWMLRIGLWIYDRLAGARRIESSGALSTTEVDALAHLRREDVTRVLHYPDCQVDDVRLVLETVLDARERGADVGNYREVVGAEAADHGWVVRIRERNGDRLVDARFLVNAAGPWAGDVDRLTGHESSARGMRLVRGSHIVVRQPAPAMANAWTLQLADGRVVFVVPWLDDCLMIGTTEVRHREGVDHVHCTEQERNYLLATYNEHFRPAIGAQDVIWSWAGVRALHDDGAGADHDVSRRHAIEARARGRGGMVTVYGGKLTTHRRLAEEVLSRIAGLGAAVSPPWTRGAAVHGGALDRAALAALAGRAPPGVGEGLWRRWVWTYGSCAGDLHARSEAEPGSRREVASGITAAELAYALEVEDVRAAEDFLFRRTKTFLHLDEAQRHAVAKWIGER